MTQEQQGKPSRASKWTVRILAVLLIVFGLLTGVGGFELLLLGGSPYYTISGLFVVACGAFLLARRREAALLYLLFLLGTVIWSICESGFDGWRLLPRLGMPVVLGCLLFLPGVFSTLKGSARLGLCATLALFVLAICAGTGLHALRQPVVDPIYQNGSIRAPAETVSASLERENADDWTVWGRNDGGTRFSPLDQITPHNVGQLKVAWTYRTGDLVRGDPRRLSVTPLKVGKTVYLCTGTKDVVALDAETGKQKWRYRSEIDQLPGNTNCRGVAFYNVPNSTGYCATRIITNTPDAQLIALDAQTGKPCPNFGANGKVPLLDGIGATEQKYDRFAKGYYKVGSAPVIIRGRIIIGGNVLDNQFWGEPSGVIRAYDAVSGKLSWAFDVGQLDRHGERRANELYTPSTPNSWAPISADEELGLVYVPTGNATPDFYGAQRRPFDEKYASATIAIDAETGKPRWVFQSTHHDLWDYDVPSQPVLVDIPGTGGSIRRALIQTTKQGDIFVLDRVTGSPITSVVERPVPSRGHAPGERIAPTQPLSLGMPSLAGPRLQEADMWGISPLDQLWCRIAFRKARYDGPYTPPGLTGSLEYPGASGGSNWSGVTVDSSRGILVVNAIRMPTYIQLLTRKEADRQGMEVYDPYAKGAFNGHGPQKNTPYAVTMRPFVSPLKIPCIGPPFGTLSGIDLKSGKLIWTQALGTAEASGPFGVPSMLPLTLGTPAIGGAITTRSGLTFIAAAADGHFRAFETRTGRMLWDTVLPAGGHAIPMTYRSTESGRQFVVIAASGSTLLGSKLGDYIVAYALPK